MRLIPFINAAVALVFGVVLAQAASAAHECETSCSAQCNAVAAEYHRVWAAHDEYCNGGDVTCVLNCVARWSDGSCRDYGADYCGRNPACVARCGARWSDGSCRDYVADYCGEMPVNCVRPCANRWNDGSCRDYAPDYCGRNASCRENCTARYPDGSCRTWGADICRG